MICIVEIKNIITIGIFMGFISLFFLLTLKKNSNVPNTKVMNYFFIPVGCILSLIMIILGIYVLIMDV